MEFKLKLPQHPRDILQSLAAIEWNLPRRRRQIVIAAVAALVLLVSLCCIIASLHTPRATSVQYFTIDDGKTYFALSGANFPPFQYRGHEAVEAILFQGSDGKPFVGCLMKYTPRIQAALAAATAQNGSGGSSPADPIRDEDQLLKRPGESQWLPSSDAKAPDIWGMMTDPKTGAQVPRWNAH